MSRTCPECGAAVEYRARTVEIEEGACAGCGRSVVLAAVGTGGAEAVASARPSGTGVVPCWKCGGALEFTALPGIELDARCTVCGEMAHLTTGNGGAAGPEDDDEGEDGEGSDEEEERPRRRPMPPRGPPRPRFVRSGEGSRDREPMSRPPARPCRQCGGPIQLESNDDGTTTGRCSSCGNTFTMHPRPEGARFERRPGWGGRPSGPPRGPPRYRSAPRGPWRPRRDRDDDDDRPRRRRPRRDE